ncbi:MAG: hypothetical protein R2795_04895 [Saprospiraceae bacterium]
MQVTGYGGGTGASYWNKGVFLAFKGIITAGNNGTVNVDGTGGLTNDDENYGIYLTENTVGTGCVITSSGGAVHIRATGGSQTKDLHIGKLGVISSGNNAPILIEANSVDFAGSPQGKIDAPGADVTIRPRTTEVQIRLGGDDVLSPASSRSLGLTAAELNQITATSLTLGRNDLAIGGISVLGAVGISHIPNLSLITPMNINVAANLTAGSGLLTLSANQQATATAANFAGVTIQNGVEIIAVGTGNIQVLGKGGVIQEVHPIMGYFSTVGISAIVPGASR